MTLPQWLVLVLVAGCVGPSQDQCAPARVASCPDCGPGEVRHAFVVNNGFGEAIDQRGVGLACATCNTITLFDPAFDVQRRITFQGESPDSLGLQVAAGGDTVYVLQTDAGPPVGEFEDPPVPTHALVALAADGSERWRQDLGASRDDFHLEAGPEGPYVFGSLQPSGFYDVIALDADGGPRWTQPRDWALIAPDGVGGVLVTTHASASGPDTVQATVASLDSAGQQRWSHVWQASGTIPNIATGLYLYHAAPSSTGAMAIVGSFTGATLDLGDRTLTAPDQERCWFVAMIDPNGATLWAVAIRMAQNLQGTRVAIVDDEVILGAEYAGSGGVLGLPVSDEMDSFVAVIGPAGIVRADVLGGPGWQTLDEIVAGANGTVTVALASTMGDFAEAQLQIGSTTFAPGDGETGANSLYLVNLVP
jgi:hypothetical protein